jgi:hypothetical protein
MHDTCADVVGVPVKWATLCVQLSDSRTPQSNNMSSAESVVILTQLPIPARVRSEDSYAASSLKADLEQSFCRDFRPQVRFSTQEQ